MDYRITTDLIDLRDLDWTHLSGTSGAGGTCLKSFYDLPSGRVYYKLSRFEEGVGIVGHESVNEIIADRLMQKLCINHLPCQLLHALVRIAGEEYETWICASESYRKRGESKCSLELFYRLMHQEGEDMLSFCRRMGWETEAYQMLLLDYLIANRDRSAEGIEVIQEARTGNMRLAPIHDQGSSLLFQYREDSVASELDVMRDISIRSFAGTKSSLENLTLLPKGKALVHPLAEEDREDIFYQTDSVLSRTFQDKIWEMIWKRWEHYEAVCNQGSGKQSGN